jgi:hypothetical protein
MVIFWGVFQQTIYWFHAQVWYTLPLDGNKHTAITSSLFALVNLLMNLSSIAHERFINYYGIFAQSKNCGARETAIVT